MRKMLILRQAPDYVYPGLSTSLYELRRTGRTRQTSTGRQDVSCTDLLSPHTLSRVAYRKGKMPGPLVSSVLRSFGASAAERIERWRRVSAPSPGFTLIEILIALVMASIISAALFTTFGQVQRSFGIVQRVTATDARVLVINAQLGRDVSGAFAPRYWQQEKEQKQQPKGEDKKPTQHNSKKKPEKMANIFKSVADDKGNLRELTFITCNPLEVYDAVTPRVVRVTYTLSPDEAMSGTFVLKRRETTDIAQKKKEDKKQQGIDYVVSSGIKKLKATYYIPEEEKQEEKQKKEPKIIYKKVGVVGEAPKDEQKTQLYVLPAYVLFELTLDAGNNEEESYDLRYTIFAWRDSKQEEKKEEVPAQQQQAQPDKAESKTQPAKQDQKQPSKAATLGEKLKGLQGIKGMR